MDDIYVRDVGMICVGHVCVWSICVRIRMGVRMNSVDVRILVSLILMRLIPMTDLRGRV